MTKQDRTFCWPVALIVAAHLVMATSFAYGEEFSAEGKIETTNDHDVHELSDSHVVLLASMQERLVFNDQTNPWHEATGPCGGAVEIKDGAVSGNGLCTFQDKAGDQFVIAWTAKSLNEKGGPVGVWRMTGGTGRYIGAEASGEYSDVPSEDPRVSTVSLTGSLILKQ